MGTTQPGSVPVYLYPYDSRYGYVRCGVLGGPYDRVGRLARGSRTTSRGVLRVHGYARCTRVPAGLRESRRSARSAGPSESRRQPRAVSGFAVSGGRLRRLSDGPRTSGGCAAGDDSPTVRGRPARELPESRPTAAPPDGVVAPAGSRRIAQRRSRRVLRESPPRRSEEPPGPKAEGLVPPFVRRTGPRSGRGPGSSRRG